MIFIQLSNSLYDYNSNTIISNSLNYSLINLIKNFEIIMKVLQLTGVFY